MKLMLTGGMATPGSDPNHAQYSLGEVVALTDRAHQLGMRVAAHALSAEGVEVAIEGGIDTLEHGWTVTGRSQDFTPELADRIAKSGIVGSVTTHDFAASCFPAASRRATSTKSEGGLRHIGR